MGFSNATALVVFLLFQPKYFLQRFLRVHVNFGILFVYLFFKFKKNIEIKRYVQLETKTCNYIRTCIMVAIFNLILPPLHKDNIHFNTASNFHGSLSFFSQNIFVHEVCINTGGCTLTVLVPDLCRYTQHPLSCKHSYSQIGYTRAWLAIAVRIFFYSLREMRSSCAQPEEAKASREF